MTNPNPIPLIAENISMRRRIKTFIIRPTQMPKGVSPQVGSPPLFNNPMVWYLLLGTLGWVTKVPWGDLEVPSEDLEVPKDLVSGVHNKNPWGSALDSTLGKVIKFRLRKSVKE